MKSFLAAAVILLACMANEARACEYCFISEHGYVFDMNRTLLRLDTRYQSFSGLTNTSRLNDDVSTQYVTTVFTANYATGRWGVTLTVPFVYRFQRNSFTGTNALHYQHFGRVVSTIDSSSLESHAVRGFGDASALVRYAVLSVSGEKFVSLFVQGGAKMATGSIDARDAFGYLLHPHLQVGTGTTLALIGVSGSYGGVRLSADGSVLAGIPVGVSGPFREGAGLNYDLGVRVRLFPEDPEDGPMLIQHIGVIGRVSWKERYKDAEVPDSGGHYMFLSGGLSFIPVPGISIDFFAQFPLAKDLTGNQINEQYRLASGIQAAF